MNKQATEKFRKATRLGWPLGIFGLFSVLVGVYQELALAFVLLLRVLMGTVIPFSLPGPLPLLGIVLSVLGLEAFSLLCTPVLLSKLRRTEGTVVGIDRARMLLRATQLRSYLGLFVFGGIALVLVSKLAMNESALPIGGDALSFLQNEFTQIDRALSTLTRHASDYLFLPLCVIWLLLHLFSSSWILWASLLPPRVSSALWWTFDSIIAIAFLGALYVLPFRVREALPAAQAATSAAQTEKQLAGVALAITFLFALRVVFRLMPSVLDLFERVGIRSLLAARMIRSKKSGYLKAIGWLSILSVAFATAVMTLVLSVMGGFRNDLRRKILGNHAHVVVDQVSGHFEGWDPLLQTVRSVEGVRGATPYVSGEVMISSATNLEGGELRGIDPSSISVVTDLQRNIRVGNLEWLEHPEEIHFVSRYSNGSADSLEGNKQLDAFGSPPALGSQPSSLREEDLALLGSSPRSLNKNGGNSIPDLDGFLREAPAPARRPTGPVLPGVIIGQELARNLGVDVGDEVQIVSPKGELGPTGPIPKTRAFRVAAIFYSGMYEYDLKLAFTSLSTGQNFFSTGDAISGIEVKVDELERGTERAASIRTALNRSELRVRAWQEVNRNLFGALELEKLAMFITLSIAILVASFCIVATLLLMVQEKGREVAILKAMGSRDRQIISSFMLQGLLIGLAGAGLGLFFGYGTCFFAEHVGIALRPEVYYIDRLPVHLDPMEFISTGVAAVVISLLATVYPAILGSRLRPIDALRQA